MQLILYADIAPSTILLLFASLSLFLALFLTLSFAVFRLIYEQKLKCANNNKNNPICRAAAVAAP